MIFLHKSKFPFFLRLFLVFLDSNNLLPMIFQFSELGIKLKLVHGIPLDKWNWLIASSFWLTDFVWKQFLVYKLHTSNVTKAVKLSFLFLSKATAGPNFFLIPFMEVEIPRKENYSCIFFYLYPWKDLPNKKNIKVIFFRSNRYKNQTYWHEMGGKICPEMDFTSSPLIRCKIIRWMLT